MITVGIQNVYRRYTEKPNRQRNATGRTPDKYRIQIIISGSIPYGHQIIRIIYQHVPSENRIERIDNEKRTRPRFLPLQPVTNILVGHTDFT